MLLENIQPHYIPRWNEVKEHILAVVLWYHRLKYYPLNFNVGNLDQIISAVSRLQFLPYRFSGP